MENVVREKRRVSNMLCRAVASVKEANWDTTPVQRGEGPFATVPFPGYATLCQNERLLRSGIRALSRRTFSFHACLETLAEAAVLALVAMVLVDRTAASGATRVRQVATH